MDKKLIDELWSELPHRYAKELAKRSGLSMSTVIKVRRGERDSAKVIDCAITWRDEIRKANKERLIKIKES